jgi:phosphoribosylglycinamide formyltransferase 1
VLEYLRSRETDLVVLAGFLWLVPTSLISHYTVVNIHPALLPKYGGKNMYGRYVHEAVIGNREKFSGITIHYVNEDYDEGAIIFQATCEVRPDDTPESLAERIHLLEYEHYPVIIEQVIKTL